MRAVIRNILIQHQWLRQRESYPEKKNYYSDKLNSKLK